MLDNNADISYKENATIMLDESSRVFSNKEKKTNRKKKGKNKSIFSK